MMDGLRPTKILRDEMMSADSNISPEHLAKIQRMSVEFIERILMGRPRKTPQSRSEFGSGMIVCLVKFSEHLWNPGACDVMALIYHKRNPSRKVEDKVARLIAVYGDMDAALSRTLELWASATSDHFADLDRTLAPTPLCELADLLFAMRSTEAYWDQTHWQRIHDLWRLAALELDEAFGIRPDWGQY